MKTFQVYMYETPQCITTRVYSDGEPIVETEENHGNYFIKYEVVEFDEYGVMEDTKHYYGNDQYDLLDQIKEDYPPEEWQNHEW